MSPSRLGDPNLHVPIASHRPDVIGSQYHPLLLVEPPLDTLRFLMSVELLAPSLEYPVISFRIVLESQWLSDNSYLPQLPLPVHLSGSDPSDDPVIFIAYSLLSRV